MKSIISNVNCYIILASPDNASMLLLPNQPSYSVSSGSKKTLLINLFSLINYSDTNNKPVYSPNPPIVNILKDSMYKGCSERVSSIPSNQLSPEKLKQKEFVNDLQRQIELKRQRKVYEKQKEIEEDKRIMQEQQQYQYFGRSGVGSVRRDIFGNPIFSKKIDPNFVSNLYAREIYNNALPSIQNQNIMTVVPQIGRAHV